MVVNSIKFLEHLYVVTFYPNSALERGVELLISSCHLPSTALTFCLQKHFALPKIRKFVQNPIPERVRKENGRETALPHEDSIMITWRFCPSLPSCLACTVVFLWQYHTPLLHYTLEISNLSQMHRWEKTPGIHHWSCSYYSRAPKKSTGVQQMNHLLIFTLWFRLLHCFVKMHQVHEHKHLSQLAHSVFLLVTRQEPQNVKIKRQGRKNHFKGKRLLSSSPKHNKRNRKCWLTSRSIPTKCHLIKQKDWLDNAFLTEDL